MADTAHEAVLLSMFYAASSAPPLTDASPVFRRIWVWNIHCSSADVAVRVHGLEDSPI